MENNISYWTRTVVIELKILLRLVELVEIKVAKLMMLQFVSQALSFVGLKYCSPWSFNAAILSEVYFAHEVCFNLLLGLLLKI